VAKNGVFTQNTASLLKNNYHNIGFQEKKPIFSPKIGKKW
jgi:hypothetical protein